MCGTWQEVVTPTVIANAWNQTDWCFVRRHPMGSDDILPNSAEDIKRDVVLGKPRSVVKCVAYKEPVMSR